MKHKNGSSQEEVNAAIKVSGGVPLCPAPQHPSHGAAYLLRPIDDEIASRIKRTLVQLTKVSVRQATQEAVCGAEHDGDFTNEGFLMLCLNLVLPLLDDRLCDVHIQGGRIPEVGGRDRPTSEASVLRR